MKVTTKGQVTIPQDIRNKLGIMPYSEVRFVEEGDRVYIEKAAGKSGRGRRLVEHMRGRGTANLNMTTDEIMELLRGD